MTVAKEQWVIVGVIKTVRTVKGELGASGLISMSGRLTTEREPRVKGCSGSEMGAIRSGCGACQLSPTASDIDRAYHRSLAHL